MNGKVNLIPHILESLRLGSPLLLLLAAALAVLIADALLPAARRRILLPALAAGGVLAALAALLLVGVPAPERTYFFGALFAARLPFTAHAIILGAALFVILISPPYLAGRAIAAGEYYALLLFAALGMAALAASAELLALFLNLELLSIALYILAGLERRNAASTEAAFKYFLLGSFAAAFLLMGIAFVFGATGETHFPRIANALGGLKIEQAIFPHLLFGFGMIFAGFGFKLTLAPFHMYAPDVYEGAPTPVAALIATGSKVAGFTALFNFASIALAIPGGKGRALWAILYAMALAGMLIGNLGAVVQPSFKRLLAYSSIAHSSYTLIPIVIMLATPALYPEAQSALTAYLLAYTVMTLLAFGVASALGRAGEGGISEFRGLGRRSPWLAAALALALISLVGIPPTIGFFGKFQVFSLAVRGGHLGLAIVGVLSSVASAFYYLRVVVLMYMEPADDAQPATAAAFGPSALALALGALGIFALIFVGL